MRVDVVEFGPREHYAVPLMLERLGLLRTYHAGLYLGRGSSMHCLKPFLQAFSGHAGVRKLLGRSSSLAASHVCAHNLLELEFRRRMRRVADSTERTMLYHWFFKQMAHKVAASTREMPDAIVGFRGSGDLFKHFRGRSICVLDQIDGGVFGTEEVIRNQKAHPDWVWGKPDWETCQENNTPYWLDLERPRLLEEQNIADVIVCNSQWTKFCLQQSGINVGKCKIIPLAYKPPASPAARGPATKNKIRLAFLGNATMAKGLHILLPALRKAREEVDATLSVAGLIQINPARLEEYKDIATFLGKIPRQDVPSFLARHDVLALPSISEGFGIVQLEAMSYGLPVISSDHTGDVVQPGHNGLVVKAGDVDALAQAIVSLAKDPDALREMSINALQRSRDFAPEKIELEWKKLFESLGATKQSI